MSKLNTHTNKGHSAALEPEPYFRVSRVAEILDISRPSVYDLIRTGQLTGVTRVGARLRIPQRAVEDLIAKGLVA